MDTPRCSVRSAGAMVVGLAATFAVPASAQDLSAVPGVPINYIESPIRIFGEPIFPQYIGSPSITVMPNGNYIATHDIFGSGSGENTTVVFRSTDKGQTWQQQATIGDAFWSTVFELNGDLYLWGYREGGSNGDVLIRKSTNEGASWSSPTLLLDVDWGGTPNTPVVHDGRLWIALSGKRVMSAPVGSNLMSAGSWTLSNTANTNNSPFGDAGIYEGQVVASPQHGVVVLPKIRGHPNSVILRVDPGNPAKMINPSADDYVELPGGEKKFGVRYDPGSDRYYALTNVVLPAHADDPVLGDEPDLIRNTAAMLSSPDLVNWDVEKLFLYTPNIDNGTYGEAFQYFNFIIDDVDGDGSADDLAIVSRTAFDTEGDGSQNGENVPPRGHDSNLMTFHSIDDFRAAGPDFYLTIESGQVNRYESTQYADAPLGTFAIGDNFAGSPLTNPDGLATDTAAGYVYIRESGGRILQFDEAGNFLDTVGSLPAGLSWNTGDLDIGAPGKDNRTWTRESDGDWADPLNWFYWGRPDTNEEIAHFGSAATSIRDVSINSGETFTVKGLHFDSPTRWVIDGDGELHLDADSGNASITVLDGYHYVRVDTTLYDHVDVDVPDAADQVSFRSKLDLNGRTLTKTGEGWMSIADELVMNGGKIVLDGLRPLNFYDGSAGKVTLDGKLEFDPDPSLALTQGQSFDLLDNVANLQGETFDSLLLPTLGSGLMWDVSSLYTNGIVSIAPHLPEPGTGAILAVALGWPAIRRRRREGVDRQVRL